MLSKRANVNSLNFIITSNFIITLLAVISLKTTKELKKWGSGKEPVF